MCTGSPLFCNSGCHGCPLVPIVIVLQGQGRLANGDEQTQTPSFLGRREAYGCVWRVMGQRVAVGEMEAQQKLHAFSKFLMVPAQSALSLLRNSGMGTAWLPGGLRLLQREKAGLPTSVMTGTGSPPSTQSCCLKSASLRSSTSLLPGSFYPGSPHPRLCPLCCVL